METSKYGYEHYTIAWWQIAAALVALAVLFVMVRFAWKIWKRKG